MGLCYNCFSLILEWEKEFTNHDTLHELSSSGYSLGRSVMHDFTIYTVQFPMLYDLFESVISSVCSYAVKRNFTHKHSKLY